MQYSWVLAPNIYLKRLNRWSDHWVLNKTLHCLKLLSCSVLTPSKHVSAALPLQTWLNQTIYCVKSSYNSILHICPTKETQSEQSKPTLWPGLSDPIVMIKMKREPRTWWKIPCSEYKRYQEGRRNANLSVVSLWYGSAIVCCYVITIHGPEMIGWQGQSVNHWPKSFRMYMWRM